MEKLPDVSGLSPEAKDALIKLLWEELQGLRKRVEALENRPKKTSKNSSKPPSKGFKANKVKQQGGARREASVGRAGGGRGLHLNPHQIVSAHLQYCPSCDELIPQASQRLHSRYDKIELPPIEPIVTRVERYQGKCPACGQRSVASVPPELAAGSPFGETIERLVPYLRYGHAISYQRLHYLLKEVFNLSISEGAIANLLARVKARLAAPLGEIKSRLQHSALICSDETSARVQGKTEWEWVFQNGDVCFHVICPSRGANVIYAVLGEHTPTTWVSDMFSAQRCHPGQQWQVCLAHQLRDTQYAIDAGDDIFAPAMKQLFLSALAIHKRRDQLADSTRHCYRLGIQRRFRRILALAPDQADGQRLKKRYEAIPDNLFLFLEDSSIPPTNNSSEQAIRMSTLFRKVTNGFRSEWGKELFAAVRSVVNTGQRQGLSALQSIETALSAHNSLFQPS
ncbi:MAG: IS66 family transposase [Cyanobacteria bacterium P01_D01_bin.36]